MAELLRSLQDSQLVARFQRRCGLFPAPEEVPRHAGSRGAGAPAHGLRSVAAPQLVMYIGQVAKDILKWPRPLSPPVVKLEKRVIAEYGMPSTHAMAATVISFTLLISTRDRYQYPFILGLLMAVLFSTLVCLSRLYTGMHTVLDVLGGIAVTAVLLVLTYPAWSLIDRLDSASPVLPVCAAVVPFLLCYHYPAPDFYSPTRADTTTILAAGAGVTIGSWINHFFQLAAAPAPAPAPPPRPPGPPGLPPLPPPLSLSLWLSAAAAGLALSLTKFAVGIALVLAVRRLVQALSLQVLCSWFRVVPRDKEARRRLEIEVPYKFVTYASVGICATTFVPMLHRFLGLP
ncbi:sphingosine-1-phosphate phosphatase 2 isoform X2 [Vulpes vulpes]|uniref:Sphingosine-1-phosphate phosphatase 2 isoform X2 n=1 Tax=Vulpes vulpes TaxID=9627 RepID=A0ABM4Z6U2_VULVU|nr:sphingosine-1-phosphate phosphatase 2 isoform X2 [Vulpes lagopus]